MAASNERQVLRVQGFLANSSGPVPRAGGSKEVLIKKLFREKILILVKWDPPTLQVIAGRMTAAWNTEARTPVEGTVLPRRCAG